jgi:hypothetical protein
MAVKELKSRILKLLKEDEEFRYAIAGLLGIEEMTDTRPNWSGSGRIWLGVLSFWRGMYLLWVLGEVLWLRALSGRV